MNTDLYTSGAYAAKHSEYHVADSGFKWRNFRSCIEQAAARDKCDISAIRSVAEVGCGAGQILAHAKESGLFADARFGGWDINPEAVRIARSLSPDIEFSCGDFLLAPGSYDMVLCADVMEHVEDILAFLRNLSRKSRYFLFNIPLEVSLITLLRGESTFKRSHESVGHLHFFTKPTALRLLRVCGYDIVHTRFAKNRTARLPRTTANMKRFLLAPPQAFVDIFSLDLAAILFGDSLVVLATGDAP